MCGRGGLHSCLEDVPGLTRFILLSFKSLQCLLLALCAVRKRPPQWPLGCPGTDCFILLSFKRGRVLLVYPLHTAHSTHTHTLTLTHFTLALYFRHQSQCLGPRPGGRPRHRFHTLGPQLEVRNITMGHHYVPLMDTVEHSTPQ